jgi:membrane protease YdiL (CAAX protease family)
MTKTLISFLGFTAIASVVLMIELAFELGEWQSTFVYGSAFYLFVLLLIIRPDDFSFKDAERPSVIVLPLSILLLVNAIFCITLQVEVLGWNWLEDTTDYPPYSDTLYFLSDVFLVVALAPIVEEIFFRRSLYHFFSKKLPMPVCILLVAILFSILHADLFGAFVFSIVMSVCYLKTQSLRTSISLHALHNGLILLIVFLTDNGFIPDIEVEITDFFMAHPLLLSLGIISSVVAIYWLTKELINRVRESDSKTIAIDTSKTVGFNQP